MTNTPTIRILDAAANRATEGLRVVEDYARFALDDAHLTGIVKNLRHALATACTALPDRHASRETRQDVGTTISTPTESKRAGPWEVCIASLERTKQSLRSLEEYSKIDSPSLSTSFESLRYQLYTLERALAITQKSRMRLRDVRLCILLDGQDSPESFKQRVAQLLDAGVGMIQLRDKSLPDAQLIERARLLRSMIPRQDGAQNDAPIFIINDRPDIAALADADGVHLGQDDMSVKDARSIVGPRKLIGVSTHSIEQARTAVLNGANYLGAGPTFPSSTKSFDTFPGLDYLKQLAEEIRLPTFAIGGINAKNLNQVLATGITRVAVSSAATEAKQLLRLLPPSD
ncbi:MAG: thiamine phosphate synthase [Planctomycetes bacterium]|nr:thiamine phosphate synthase [Planctomycetota bacterium]